MSCRGLGQQVENMVVRENYARLGFSTVFRDDAGLTRWELDADGEGPEAAQMKVVSRGFPASRCTQ